jgi:hypothetical protein
MSESYDLTSSRRTFIGVGAAALVATAVGCESKPASEAPKTQPAEGVGTPPPAATPATAASIPGPVPGTRYNEGYVSQMGRSIYFWGWPMMNIHNRKVTFEKLPGQGYLGGILPVAPSNSLTMLRDYIKPEERAVACPNQDVVYGLGILDFTKEPVVVQVPDFGSRFWVYQIVDERTDSFAKLGKMYDTKPGFYLLTGPGWSGTVPNGIAGVFHASTKVGVVIPRVFKESTPEDTQAVQPLISQITMYPLSKFNNQMQTMDWSKIPDFPSPAGASQEETKWVIPDKFFDELSDVLDETPPMPGEEPMYANIRAILDAAQKDPKLKAALVASASDAEKNMVAPLFQFHNYGFPLTYNWTTQKNGADFGTDYYTRTAVAKSNIFVNTQNETKYFYQDLDSTGARLNGAHSYTVTFPAGQLPPVKGFWSLTMYNEHHFFEPNKLVRYSLGTKNKDLQTAADGSLTIYVSATPPSQDKMSNWLPSPKGDFSVYVRSYWPEEAILNGTWTPPAVVKVR